MSRKWLSVACLVVAVVLLVGVVPVGAAPSQGDVVHVVQRGETLYSIARRYSVGMWDIARANGLTNPNRIYVGQRLVIPGTAPAGSTGGQVYIVRAGDTLYRIALRYKL
ncbi:MAG: LysM peptidoglycan-binding domain-containing protein, partial [Anaerolineales bacterium]|nr:LysM peptidoglycan-binding domain-containing protein [Anaerolineales bacterium]